MAALAALEPTTVARERMVTRYLPLADSLARRYKHTSEPLEDLTQVARLGLLKAVDRWDPERGNAFSTFAVPTITGELRRHFRDRAWTIRPPRGLQELHTHVQRVRAALATELGREPSVGDIAAAIGCEVEGVVEALSAGDAYAPHSLDAPLQGDADHVLTGADQLPDGRREIGRTEDATALWQLGKALDARAWEVIRLRFEEDLTQREIGALVGCSQMQVSRILRDALSRLREAADDASVVFE